MNKNFENNFGNNFQSGWATQGLGVLPAQSYDGHCGKGFIQGSVFSVVELDKAELICVLIM